MGSNPQGRGRLHKSSLPWGSVKPSVPSLSFFSSAFTRRSSFFVSSAGGRFSGTIPRSMRLPRTLVLFSTCSCLIWSRPYRSCSSALKAVIEFVRSFALMRTSANLSANAALLGTPSCCFISAVLLPPNNASSPFDLMIANPLESTPRLNAMPESCFSESDSEWRACKR